MPLHLPPSDITNIYAGDKNKQAEEENKCMRWDKYEKEKLMQG